MNTPKGIAVMSAHDLQVYFDTYFESVYTKGLTEYKSKTGHGGIFFDCDEIRKLITAQDFKLLQCEVTTYWTSTSQFDFIVKP